MASGVPTGYSRSPSGDNHSTTGPGTDLRFSVAGIPAVGCAGERNLPDGEVFTCPVKESVEGTLAVNASSLYQGVVFENVVLKFKGGKIVSAEANHTERLNTILDTDDGARYIGESSLDFNPRILQPMMDILFDEKIAGSFHFTPGQAYGEADNGNRSEVHWDLVTIQRPDYGGGEVYFDEELIRKDGQFVVPELTGLNPSWEREQEHRIHGLGVRRNGPCLTSFREFRTQDSGFRTQDSGFRVQGKSRTARYRERVPKSQSLFFPVC